jgi:hypothetical protein
MISDEQGNELAKQLHDLVMSLHGAGRNDLLLQAISVPVLEELRIDAARGQLSHLVITADYHFFLSELNNIEVELSPVEKAVYLFFLKHPEGIRLKDLSDFRPELYHFYKETSSHSDISKIAESVDRLVDPFDNAINEKCSRIKHAFTSIMDEYSAMYYMISSHIKYTAANSKRTWYERLKVITLPRELVIYK